MFYTRLSLNKLNLCNFNITFKIGGYKIMITIGGIQPCAFFVGWFTNFGLTGLHKTSPASFLLHGIVLFSFFFFFQ